MEVFFKLQNLKWTKKKRKKKKEKKKQKGQWILFF